MKVKANTPVRYKDVSYPAGQEFEISAADYEQHKKILIVTEEDKELDKDLADLSVSELKELAKEKGIDGFDKMKKVELIAVLEDDADGGPGDTENPPDDPAAGQE